MLNIQNPEILKENGIPKFAVFSYDDYLRITEYLEELEDIKDIEEFYSKEHQYFPSEIVDQLFTKHENPIKVFRKFRKITQSELAKKLGVSKPFVSQIENNKTKLSLEKAKKIAKILNVDLELIV